MNMENKGQKEPLFKPNTPEDDSFYEAIDRPAEATDEAVAASAQMTDEERDQQREEWRQQLVKLEDEIQTLQSVLSTKVRTASDLKRKLGITPMSEFKDDLRTSFKSITESDAYKKTNEQLHKLNESITHSQAYQKTNETLTSLNESIHNSEAYQKTSGAFKSFGAWSSKKLGDARNSTVFKSVEEKVGGAYTNVKAKVAGSKSDQNFQELNETYGSTGGTGEGVENRSPSPATTPTTPKQQVPL